MLCVLILKVLFFRRVTTHSTSKSFASDTTCHHLSLFLLPKTNFMMSTILLWIKFSGTTRRAISFDLAKTNNLNLKSTLVDKFIDMTSHRKKNRRTSRHSESSTWTHRILLTLTVTLLIGASCVVAKYFYNRFYLPKANVFNLRKFIQLK